MLSTDRILEVENAQGNVASLNVYAAKVGADERLDSCANQVAANGAEVKGLKNLSNFDFLEVLSLH